MHMNQTTTHAKTTNESTTQRVTLRREVIFPDRSHRPDASSRDEVPHNRGRLALEPAGNGPFGRNIWGSVWYGLLIGLPLLHVATLNAGPPDNSHPENDRNVEVRETEKSGVKQEPAGVTNSPQGKAFRRLPRFFGKLDLAAEQREKIFKIQEQYQQEMERLELELAELRLERESQVRQILSEEQRSRLDRFMEEPRTPVRQKESLPGSNESNPQPSVETSASAEEMS